jgi:signal peptidase I
MEEEHQPVVPSQASNNVMRTKNRNRRSEGFRNIVSTLLVLLIAPLIALLLTAFVFQSYQVDGPSMQPTLQNNNRLIVWKVARTWARITGHQYIPDRGDIIIFNTNGLPDFGETGKQLIKRVIALPGERVVVKNGTLTVYNKQHPNGFRPDATLPYGSVITDTQGDEDIVVPQGSVFVCGDNRNDSLDSRVFGPVPVNNIVGKLVYRVLPIDEAKTF